MMKTVAEAGGLRVRTWLIEGSKPYPWTAYVEAGIGATVGSAHRCRTEREAIDSALFDADRNLEALADNVREALADDQA